MGARGPKPGPRLSVEPMDAAMRRYNIDVEFIEGKMNSNIRWARSAGYVTLAIADDFACKVLKMHPIEVWGEEYVEKIHHDLGKWDDVDILPDEDAA